MNGMEEIRKDIFKQCAEAYAKTKLDEADAERFRKLSKALFWDGYGYWTPEICVKDAWVDRTEGYTPEPTLDEWRISVDKYLESKL